jgi:hypothetical protein
MRGISPKLEAFTWQVNPYPASNLPLPGFFFASLRLGCSPPIAGFRFNRRERRELKEKLAVGQTGALACRVKAMPQSPFLVFFALFVVSGLLSSGSGLLAARVQGCGRPSNELSWVRASV